MMRAKVQFFFLKFLKNKLLTCLSSQTIEFNFKNKDVSKLKKLPEQKWVLNKSYVYVLSWATYFQVTLCHKVCGFWEYNAVGSNQQRGRGCVHPIQLCNWNDPYTVSANTQKLLHPVRSRSEETISFLHLQLLALCIAPNFMHWLIILQNFLEKWLNIHECLAWQKHNCLHKY